MKSNARSAADTFRAIATIVLGLVVLGAFIVALGGFRFWERFTHYTVLFDAVRDLNVGQPVKLDGMNIGRVIAIGPFEEDPSLVKVTLGVRDKLPIYSNCYATISQKGLVGDYYVLLTLEGNAGEILPPESRIASRKVPGLSELGAVIGETVASLKPKLERIATGMELLLTPENIHNITTVLADLETLVKSAQQTVQTLHEEVDGLGDQAKSTMAQGSKTLDQASASLLAIEREFSSTAAELRTQVHALGTQYGALGKQVQVDLGYNQEQLAQVLDQVQRLTEELTVLTQDVKDKPWRLLRAPSAFPEVRP